MTKSELLQKAKPIILDTESVRAILDERKTTARQVIKPQPKETQTYKLGYCTEGKDKGSFGFGTCECGGDILFAKPKYQAGDILYVREAWQEVYETEYNMNAEGYCVNIRTLIVNFDSIPKICSGLSTGCSCSKIPPRNKYYVYKASNVEYSDAKNELRWLSPVTMPKEAARIFLRVTGVRVERQDAQDKCKGCKATFGCDLCVYEQIHDNEENLKLYEFVYELRRVEVEE